MAALLSEGVVNFGGQRHSPSAFPFLSEAAHTASKRA